jgi:methionyl-tRNA formyltransferase
LIERWPIKAHGTTASLLKRFQSRAGCAIVEALDRLLSGIQPVPQSGESSWVPRLSGDEPFELDLDRSLRWNLTRIRAGSFPGHAAFVDLEGGRLNIAAWPDEAKEGGHMK